MYDNHNKDDVCPDYLPLPKRHDVFMQWLTFRMTNSFVNSVISVALVLCAKIFSDFENLVAATVGDF